MKIVTARTPPALCPQCGMDFDCASGIAARPKPGSFTLCGACGCLCRFTDAMGIRRATLEDLQGLPSDFLRQLFAAQNDIKNRPLITRPPDGGHS